MFKRRRLNVFYGSRHVGVLDDGDGRYCRLTYDDTYRLDPSAVPMSASLPLSHAVHDGVAVDNFLWNLLPEHPHVLESLQRRYKIGDLSDPLSILRDLGRDIAGAFCIYPEDIDPTTDGMLVMLRVADIAHDLRSLRHEPYSSAARISLAGAQPKTSYVLGRDGKWYLPTGIFPSTHIFKPLTANPHLADLDVVEHFVTSLARELGLTVSESYIAYFEDQRTLITRRYDRAVDTDGQIVRVHQEDLMQMLGLPRARKYEIDGGPGLTCLVHTIKNYDPASETRLWQLLAFNVAVGNADAHAKNYSFLVTPHGHRLAPAYDLISLIPYRDYSQELAMKVGYQRSYRGVRKADWLTAAKRAGTDPTLVIDAVEHVGDNLRTAAERVMNTLEYDTSRAITTIYDHIRGIPQHTHTAIHGKAGVAAMIEREVAALHASHESAYHTMQPRPSSSQLR